MELEREAATVTAPHACGDVDRSALDTHNDAPLPEPLTQTMQAENVGNALEGTRIAYDSLEVDY
mgnify:FL=1